MTFSSPLALLLMPIVCGGSVWLWAAAHHTGLSLRRVAALCVRLGIFALLILAAAGVTVVRPRTAQAVSFVGDLSVSTQAGQSDIVRYIDDALRARGNDDLAALVAMGRSASVERPPAPLAAFQGFESVVDPDFTNIEAGLSLGGALLPSSYRRRVVLLSDGRQNVGDAVGEAQVLRQQGIRVDVVPVSVKPGPEVRVDSLTVPGNLRKGERFTLLAQVASTVRTSTRYVILEDDRPVRRGTTNLSIGQTAISADFEAGSPGLHTFTIQLQPRSDTLAQNNQASAITEVDGPPRVLVVEGAPGGAANVTASLRAGGILTDTVEADAVSPDLSVLQRYAAVVLVDVPADVLGVETMNSLKTYVADLGRGLVAIGGLNSYGLGNYGSSPLESALPVNMDLPKRKDLPRAAVVLIIEDLESQASVDISKRAGEGVVGLLNPEDLVAVSDAGPNLVWPLRHVTDKSAVIHAIDAMQPLDPISYAPYLTQAYNVLRAAKVQTKQIILLGDGDADNDTSALLKKITAAGIQVSTIETNASAASDFQNMRDIAAHGGGKYYPADDVTRIPQVFLKVARTVAHNGIIEGKFIPRLDASSPIVSGITKVSPLSGYVITTPKTLATVVLASEKSDPILAQWQYGLGRSVAWTSDSQGRWTSTWLANPQTRNVWSAMVHWVLPPPRSANLSLSASVAGGQISIAVDSADAMRFQSLVAHIVGQNSRATVALEPDAQNHYSSSIDAGNAGAYSIDVQATLSGAAGKAPVKQTITGGVVVPYATDYRDTGDDIAALGAIAAAGGGAVLPNAAAAFADNLPTAMAPTPLQAPLLLIALLLLPVDVGIRRLTLTRADVAAILRSLLPWRRSLPTEQKTMAPLARVRQRRAAARPSRLDHGSNAMPSRAASKLPPTKRKPVSLASAHARPEPEGKRADPDHVASTSEADEAESVAMRLLAAKRRRAKQ